MWPLKHAIKSAFYEENFTCMRSVHSGTVGRCFVDLKTWIKKSLMTLFTYYIYILLLLLVGFVNSHLQTFPSLLLSSFFVFAQQFPPAPCWSTAPLVVVHSWWSTYLIWRFYIGSPSWPTYPWLVTALGVHWHVAHLWLIFYLHFITHI